MKLNEVFDTALFDEMVEQGYISLRQHPEKPLVIANYTAKAMYENVWNEVTIECRGLVYDSSNRVVARPMRKFFNWGQVDINLPLNHPVLVMDKVDGSLIHFTNDDEYGFVIGSRGSFTSEQAQWATNWMAQGTGRHGKVREWMESRNSEWTYCFEAVYPENRIVLDYGEDRELFLLGLRHIGSGDYLPAKLWPGLIASRMEYNTVGEALAAPPRKNAEGLVVISLNQDLMFKIKQEDYVKLHKVVTGLTRKKVWEAIQDHDLYEKILNVLPDEFADWFKKVEEELYDQHTDMFIPTLKEYGRVMTELSINGKETRRDFAAAVADKENKSLLFTLYDDKPIDAMIWKMIEPKGSEQPVFGGNDE